MDHALVSVLRNQVRGVTGALLVVGLTFLYTMETWWWAWTLPLSYLVGYALVGLALVTLVARSVGFREEDEDRQSRPWWHVAVDSAEVLTQSFVAAYVILVVLGLVSLDSSLNLLIRMGLIYVVPLGFGAAMANRLFGTTTEEQAHREGMFPLNLAVFAVGALFLSSTIAPTRELELIPVYMGWPNYVALVALTLVLVYLVLFELEFKGKQARTQRHWRFQVGTVFIVYAVGAGVSVFLLTAFGHFIGAPLAVIYQETVVLAFPASLGAAGAEVLI